MPKCSPQPLPRPLTPRYVSEETYLTTLLSGRVLILNALPCSSPTAEKKEEDRSRVPGPGSVFGHLENKRGAMCGI